MPCFDEATRALIVELGVGGDTLDRINHYYDALSKYQKASLAVATANDLPHEKLALNNLEWLRQGILHRAQSLTKAAGLLAVGGHPHAVALCCRGQLESTAQVGYLARKAAAYLAGDVSPKDMSLAMGNMLLAAGHPDYSQGPKPINVMTFFQKADKHLAPIMKELMPQPDLLEDQYAWLSDFCHPNFQSMGLSTTLDSEANLVTFHHGAGLGGDGAKLFHNLGISTACFLMLWDDLEKTTRELTA